MKVRLQKKRFSEEWVSYIACGTHNHASNRPSTLVGTSETPDLESALYDWHVAQLSSGEVVHGNTLKAKALALFTEMPQYRGQKPPNLTREWLDQYRMRHNLPGKISRPSGPPPIIDPNAAPEEAPTETQPAQPTSGPSKEYSTFMALMDVFPDRATLNSIKDFVKTYMARYDASHDFTHVMRVFSLARRILHKEMLRPDAPEYDSQVVLLSA